ncbi:hypothetical protein ISCGN_028052 [Ixodes scapularis]
MLLSSFSFFIMRHLRRVSSVVHSSSEHVPFFLCLFFFFSDLPQKHQLVPLCCCGQIQSQRPTVSDRVPFRLRFATLAGHLDHLSSAWGRGCDMLLLFVACMFVLPVSGAHG